MPFVGSPCSLCLSGKRFLVDDASLKLPLQLLHGLLVGKCSIKSCLPKCGRLVDGFRQLLSDFGNGLVCVFLDSQLQLHLLLDLVNLLLEDNARLFRRAAKGFFVNQAVVKFLLKLFDGFLIPQGGIKSRLPKVCRLIYGIAQAGIDALQVFGKLFDEACL